MRVTAALAMLQHVVPCMWHVTDLLEPIASNDSGSNAFYCWCRGCRCWHAGTVKRLHHSPGDVVQARRCPWYCLLSCSRGLQQLVKASAALLWLSILAADSKQASKQARKHACLPGVPAIPCRCHSCGINCCQLTAPLLAHSPAAPAAVQVGDLLVDIEVCGEDMELLSPPAETSQEAAAAATHHSGAAEHAPGTGEAGWMWLVTPTWSLGTAACAAALTAGGSNTAPSTACLACTACLWWDARAGFLIRQLPGPFPDVVDAGRRQQLHPGTSGSIGEDEVADRVLTSPAVRRIARENRIALEKVRGSCGCGWHAGEGAGPPDCPAPSFDCAFSSSSSSLNKLLSPAPF
jgi:hypothetical protein